MDKFTKEEITEFLQKQKTIKDAIKNLDFINKKSKKVVDHQTGEVLFYIDEEIKTKGDLKLKIIEYMGENGWEKSGYEEIMELKELLKQLDLKIE